MIGRTFVVFLLMQSPSFIQDRKPEYRPLYQLKAAWITSFLKFVRWPDHLERQDKIILGLLGDDNFHNLFDYFRTRSIRGKQLVVKKISAFQHQTDLRHCHLLYISSSEQPHLDQLLAFLGDAPVFTISELDAFIRRGGIVQFKVRGDKFSYEVNQRLASSRGLYISSQLLGRAERVDRP